MQEMTETITTLMRSRLSASNTIIEITTGLLSNMYIVPYGENDSNKISSNLLKIKNLSIKFQKKFKKRCLLVKMLLFIFYRRKTT